MVTGGLKQRGRQGRHCLLKARTTFRPRVRVFKGKYSSGVRKAHKVFYLSDREKQVAECGSAALRAQASLSARAAVTTRLLSSTTLRPSPEKLGSRTPFNRCSHYATLRRKSFPGGCPNHRTPLFSQLDAAEPHNRPPVRLFEAPTSSLLPSKLSFGIILPSSSILGLLRFGIRPPPGVVALLFSKKLRVFEKVSLSTQNANGSAQPASRSEKKFR